MTVRGIDLLGHPFEERTATLTLNMQGCRYFSKYNLPRNSWITVEIGNGEPHNMSRARVAWIHRPHSIRELFQVAIELEEAGNIWGLPGVPEDGPQNSTREAAPDAGAPRNGENTAFGSFVIPENVPKEIPEDIAKDILNDIPKEESASSMTSNPADFSNAGNPSGSEVQSAQSTEHTAAIWRERLTSEMAVAQQQWDELLQSSIDRMLHRLAEQLPERTQDAVRLTEEKMKEQFAHLGQMLGQMSAEAQNALSSVKASIDQELWRARDALDGLRHQTLERIGSEVEARIAPHAARVPELLRELTSREDQVGESLRLHRERLRQAADHAVRDVTSQIEAASAGLRSDFEKTRSEALTRWNEEVEALSARAGHSAGESIARTSEWHQQETRERLQVLVEQTVAAATATFEQETAKATGHFATQLEGQSAAHLAHIQQQLDGAANDTVGRTRTQLSEAAEAAAASFGQVLHNISSERAEEFRHASQSVIDQRRQEMESTAQEVKQSFDTDSNAAAEAFRQLAASHLDSAVTDAKEKLAAESNAALETHRGEREARLQDWTQDLNRLAGEAVDQCNGRIQTAADAWTVASVRRLNEHGQNIIESLMRSADQALRESASRIFEGLATTLREQGPIAAAGAAAAAGLGTGAPPPASDPQMPPPGSQDMGWQSQPGL
jgi:hypothetical protein